jgi:hypothetical protein
MKVAKKHEHMKDSELNPKVAYHVGYQFPAYGRQKLNECLLSLHPSQPIYCDTDSIIYKVDRDLVAQGVHKELKTGPYLGDLVDECAGKRILEIAIVAPKSYAMRLEDIKTKKQEIKVKFKGIPLCSATYSLLNSKSELAKLGFEELKQLVENAVWGRRSSDAPRTEFELKYKNIFKRNPKTRRIEPKEDRKTTRFTFDKRKILAPPSGTFGLNDVSEINTDAWGSDTVSLTDQDVESFWLKQRDVE